MGSDPIRAQLDPWRHQGVLVEAEPTEEGDVVDVATVFLTGRECPWHCVMCDLWRYTTVSDTPPGSIPSQVADAVRWLRERGDCPSQIKLYNAGSFFDPRAVPSQDDEPIAGALAGFTRVIVESHPALVGERTWRFRDAVHARAPMRIDVARLEVAMGLETAHEGALERLQKHVTLERFRQSADALQSHGVALRVFVLVNPPFVPVDQQDEWVARSVSFAFDCGASAVSLIPTRPGNAPMDDLARAGLFVAPRLADLERAAASAVRTARGRVFADLWDLERFSECADCLDARRDRLRRMNIEQRVPGPATCSTCGEATPA